MGDVGESIRVQDEGTWYDAELVGKHLNGYTYDVKYVDNGVTETGVPLSRIGVTNPIIMSKVNIGDTVRAEDDGSWYDAELLAKYADRGTYDVRYADNGVTERGLPASRLGVTEPISTTVSDEGLQQPAHNTPHASGSAFAHQDPASRVGRGWSVFDDVEESGASAKEKSSHRAAAIAHQMADKMSSLMHKVHIPHPTAQHMPHTHNKKQHTL